MPIWKRKDWREKKKKITREQIQAEPDTVGYAPILNKSPYGLEEKGGQDAVRATNIDGDGAIAHAHTSCHRALAGTAGQRGGGKEAVVGGSTQGPSAARRRGCDVDVRLLAQRRHAARRWLCLRTAHHRCPPETCAALAGDGCLVTLAPQESPPPSSLFA